MQTSTHPAATVAHPFPLSGAARHNLFSIRPDVPAPDALKTAASLLNLAREAARGRAVEHLIELASDLVDAVELPREARPDERLLANVFERLNALRQNGVLIVNPAACVIERDDAESFLSWVALQAKGGEK